MVPGNLGAIEADLRRGFRLREQHYAAELQMAGASVVHEYSMVLFPLYATYESPEAFNSATMLNRASAGDDEACSQPRAQHPRIR